MKRTGIRIIKGGESRNIIELSNDHVEKTDNQSQRDTATIVKGWISEWQERRRFPRRQSSTN